MSPRTQQAIWWSIFLLIFALSQNYRTWELPPRAGLGGFPTWLYTFILLQFALAIALAIFAVTSWHTPSEDEQDHE